MRSALAPLRVFLFGTSLLAASPAFADDGACRALADSRGLSAALVGTLFGDAQSFERTQASIAAIGRDVRPDPDAPANSVASERFLASMKTHADQLLQQRDLVRLDHERLRDISGAANDLLEATETLNSLLLQNNAGVVHINAALQLVMLSQRLGRSADTVIAWDGIRPEPVFLLGKDLKTADRILAGLKDGDTELRLRAQRQPEVAQQLAKAQGIIARMKADAQPLLDHLRELVTARVAQAALQREADQLGHALAISCAGSDAGAPEPLRLPGQAASAPASSR